MSGRRCAVEGCRNAVQHLRVGLCTSHFQEQERERQLQRERRGVYATGQARQQECAEVELTDGHMCWWVTASAWDRRGWIVRAA